MPNQYEKLIQQRDQLQQKMAQENFKLRQSKFYDSRQARKARSRRLIQKGALLEKYGSLSRSTDDLEFHNH